MRTLDMPGGRKLRATPVYETYWKFAARRQARYWQRIRGGELPKWAEDPIIDAHRFTNVYRACDRVSQFLIRDVIYGGRSLEPKELFFRILFFKLFNKIETWEALEQKLGRPIAWETFQFDTYASALDALKEQGAIYSAAYMMPPPSLGGTSKHRNHLLLLGGMTETLPGRVVRATSLEQVYSMIREFPTMGPFLAFQYAIDLNYSPLCNFDEDDFVVAGPGACDGIKKCFENAHEFEPAAIIRAVAQEQDAEFFQRLGDPDGVTRPLKLIDCQNIFCETDKYARVAHPEVESRRAKIKQKYKPDPRPLPPPMFPPKWNLTL